MDLQTIELALQFLGRAQLTGSEVPAFCQVHNALMAMRAQLMSASLSPQPAEPSTNAPNFNPSPGD